MSPIGVLPVATVERTPATGASARTTETRPPAVDDDAGPTTTAPVLFVSRGRARFSRACVGSALPDGDGDGGAPCTACATPGTRTTACVARVGVSPVTSTSP